MDSAEIELKSNAFGSCDELDRKMGQVMHSLVHGFPEETRESLISEALDLFALQYQQGFDNGSSCSTQVQVETPTQEPYPSTVVSEQLQFPVVTARLCSYESSAVSADRQQESARLCGSEVTATVETDPAMSAHRCRKRKLVRDETDSVDEIPAKRARIDLNNRKGDCVLIPDKKYNVCPKTWRITPRADTVLLSDKQRRVRLKKQRSLLVQAVRRCMLLKVAATRTYCCYKKCFLRKPKL